MNQPNMTGAQGTCARCGAALAPGWALFDPRAPHGRICEACARASVGRAERRSRPGMIEPATFERVVIKAIWAGLITAAVLGAIRVCP